MITYRAMLDVPAELARYLALLPPSGAGAALRPAAGS